MRGAGRRCRKGGRSLVQYTTLLNGVRLLHRLGAQGADPGRRGDIGYVENLRPCTEWENTAVQGGDLFPVAADEPATRIGVEELSRSEGAEGTGGNFPGFKVQEAGPPQAVDTEDEDRFA